MRGIIKSLGVILLATILALAPSTKTSTAREIDSCLPEDDSYEVVQIYVPRQVTPDEAHEIVDRSVATNYPTDEDAGDGQGGPGTVGDMGSQDAVIASAHSTPTTGLHQCSLWVRNVFLDAGQPDYGNTAPYKWYDEYCFSSDKSDLQPGMIVCTSTLPFGTGNGHVGIYVGDGMVMHNTSHWVNGSVDGAWVATVSLDDWIKSYGVAATPRWGWLGGVVLS